MINLYEDGDLFLPIRTKLNNLNDFVRIATTDVIITAGAVTSIAIETLITNGAASGEKIVLLDITTGEAHDLELSASMDNADTAITIVSHTFTADVPVGSGIYYRMIDLLNYVRTYCLNP